MEKGVPGRRSSYLISYKIFDFSENKQFYERNMECMYIYKYVAKAVSLVEAPTFWGNGELDKWTDEHRGGGGSRIRKKETRTIILLSVFGIL